MKMISDASATSLVAAQPSDSPYLVKIKPGYGAEDVAERFRWLEQDVDGTWLLLKCSDDVIGWCVVVWSGKKTHPEYPDMQDLFIRPEYRSKGYGRHMVGAIERMAKTKGYSKIGLAVNPDHNQVARRLYEELAYRHDGGKKYLDGVYADFQDWVIDLDKEI